MCIHDSMCGNMHLSAGTHGVYKKVSDALELQAVLTCPVWILWLHLDLLEEQYSLLTTKPSLQCPSTVFFPPKGTVSLSKILGWHLSFLASAVGSVLNSILSYRMPSTIWYHFMFYRTWAVRNHILDPYIHTTVTSIILGTWYTHKW